MKLCGFEVGLDRPFFLIAGPCVIESKEMAHDTAGRLKEITAKLGIPFIYKSSFDKANRSSGKSFRGLGMDQGLAILAEVKRQVALLQDKSIAQRRQIVGLEPKRADVIFAGAYLIEKIMESFGASQVVVSDQGVRYGLLHEAAKTL